MSRIESLLRFGNSILGPRRSALGEARVFHVAPFQKPDVARRRSRATASRGLRIRDGRNREELPAAQFRLRRRAVQRFGPETAPGSFNRLSSPPFVERSAVVVPSATAVSSVSSERTKP